MQLGELLGRIVPLSVLRFGPPGAFLVPPGTTDPRASTILLPASEVPDGCKEGDVLDSFVYLDSEDRPIATLADPKLVLGEVAFLEVTDEAAFGAFVDWGLMKELLVPKGEQTREMRVGERHPIGLYLDDTERLAGTMRVSELLKAKGEFRQDEWVAGEAWRNEPELGLFVIVEQRYVGLVPASEPHKLARGEGARFRVSNILMDGKIELSLRGPAHEELHKDAAHVLAVLMRPDAPKVGDGSSPELIRSSFGLSKKAFKRAVGRLLKQGAVRLDPAGIVIVRPPR
jgi:predicted RNA-binding protein (virulence factor B family)